ncbi:MAG TPA: hypothetical protein VGL93_17050 [Streptosporangiaceae bacterium]
MTKVLMLVWTSPVDGRDEEFLHWYDTVHISDIRAAVAGVGDVTRYRMTRAGDDPSRYLTVYELADADPAAVTKALGEAAGSGRMEMSPAMDMTGHPPVVEFYVPAEDGM